MSLIHLTDKNFEAEVLQSPSPVLVDFWAEWCGPCKMISPVIDELSREFSGKIKIAKLNVDEAQELAAQYNVMSIPTLMFFKGGKVVDHIVGAASKDHLVRAINKNLG